MNSRHPRLPSRAQSALIHRGPQALTAAPHVSAPIIHAPNAALLIDFDNVTMGIRSDLQTELRNLLSSSIISGKVAVQRAYADWRRYPQYIVPLSESSIDLIFAPAYGSSKKNATDIRLAVDAMELVFTRPEIGTFILLSGGSDFSCSSTRKASPITTSSIASPNSSGKRDMCTPFCAGSRSTKHSIAAE